MKVIIIVVPISGAVVVEANVLSGYVVVGAIVGSGVDSEMKIMLEGNNRFIVFSFSLYIFSFSKKASK